MCEEHEDLYNCPICHKDLNEEFCPHFVATLCDDSDGFDTEVPLYFGWDSPTSNHDNVIAAMTDCLLMVKKLGVAFALVDAPMQSEIAARCAKLPPAESEVCAAMICAIRSASEYEEVASEAAGEAMFSMRQASKDLFTKFYEEVNDGSEAVDYLIADRPGLSWSGTNYWSQDAVACLTAIARRANAAEDRIEGIIATIGQVGANR